MLGCYAEASILTYFIFYPKIYFCHGIKIKKYKKCSLYIVLLSLIRNFAFQK